MATADENYEATIALLTTHGQTDLLSYISSLDNEGRRTLLSSLSTMSISEIFANHVPSALNSKAPTNITHFPSTNVTTSESKSTETTTSQVVSPCIMAGGAGTRLGFPGPKGCYPLIRNKRLYDFLIPRCDVCLTPSPPSPPPLTSSPQILLQNPTTPTSSPNGNGGIFTSLFTHSLLPLLTQKNVTALHVFGIDNLLTIPCDSTFISSVSSSDVGNKIIRKDYPEEKIGVMAQSDGSNIVVEYSDLSEEDKNLKDGEGNLVYSLGNICSHYFSVGFLSRLEKVKPTYHIANKKIEVYDIKSKEIKEVEAVKLETFVFDVFKEATSVEVVEVQREAEFAPIKNKEGKDSRDSALGLLTAMWKGRVGTEGLEEVEILDIEGWSGNEDKIRASVQKRASSGEKIITVWTQEWE
ncbi:hypothetical protein TL16_g05134 [Triparma laevis f. inornata]|uniref:UDP-N-acetylglucosamine diphosphorylase n=1 Tax=Triparma laevis f. inornata TaxID=1714386 RepID=A0A9W7AHM5_9STRA|nr:hypothetical protein TL16_g05134 [Triparma laevis f. inornata]